MYACGSERGGERVKKKVVKMAAIAATHIAYMH